MSNMRMPPWDLERGLWDQLNLIHHREQKTWRFLQTEGARLVIEKYVGAKVMPVAEFNAASPALPVAAFPAAVSAAVVPAVSVPQTEAGKKVAWLRGRVEAHKVALDEARAQILIEPEHIPSKTILRARTVQLAEDEGWLAEAEVVLAAELSSKQIDNGENEVED